MEFIAQNGQYHLKHEDIIPSVLNSGTLMKLKDLMKFIWLIQCITQERCVRYEVKYCCTSITAFDANNDVFGNTMIFEVIHNYLF